MQLLLIAQTQLCLLESAEINFCIHFEHYDLTNGLALAPQIWKSTITNFLKKLCIIFSEKQVLNLMVYLNFSFE